MDYLLMLGQQWLFFFFLFGFWIWNIRLLLSCLNMLGYVLPSNSNQPKEIEVCIKARHLWVGVVVFFPFIIVQTNKQSKQQKKLDAPWEGVSESLSSNCRWKYRDRVEASEITFPKPYAKLILKIRLGSLLDSPHNRNSNYESQSIQLLSLPRVASKV